MKPSVAAVASLLALAGPLCAQENAAAGGPVVELPKFVVTDNRELPAPEAWRYGTIPGFEVLTNASEKATQRLLRDFDMFRQALGHVWPQPDRISQTTSLIICGAKNKFDAFVPAGKVVVDAGMASLFLKKGDQTAIVIDLQATTLNVLNVDGANDAATGTDSGIISVEHDKQLYREYVRYLLSRNEPRLPAWLEEGLSQIIMRMQFDKRWIQFAKLEDPNTISAQAGMVQQLNAIATADDPEAPTLPGAPAEDRDFNAALQRKALVPMDKFFAVAHDSPEATNTLGNNRWAKQAYCFVHMCLYGLNGKYQKPFTQFLTRLGKEPPSEAMFKEIFKLSYKDMLMEMRGYIDFTVYQHKEFRSKEDVILPPKPIELREATQAEVGRIKGEAILLAGHPKAARTEMVAAYTRGERDPNLLAAIGLYEARHGEEDRARKFLEAAFAAKAVRTESNVMLARMRFAEAVAKPAGPEGRFSAAQVNAVLDPLRLARGRPPAYLPLYELAGDVWARSATTPSKDDAKLLIEGAMSFPTRLKLIFQAGVLARDAGEVRAAHALADHGIKYSPDGGPRQRFEALKATLPPAPPPEPGEAAPAAAPAGAKGAAKGTKK